MLLRSLVESCVRCGRVVSTPVRLTDLSRRPVEETYYACPFCLSRLDVGEVTEHLEGLEHSQDEKGIEEKAEMEVTVSNCAYEFGYLGSRPKDSVIPDQCLICPRILKCMVKST